MAEASRLRPKNGMPSRYVLYALRATVGALIEQATGSTFEAVNGSDLRAHEILVAPLDEQRRIVAEIEKQFTRLEAGVAALRRVQANLKRYRAAVLKAACEGRLVPTEAELAKAENRKPSKPAKNLSPASSPSAAKTGKAVGNTKNPPHPKRLSCRRSEGLDLGDRPATEPCESSVCLRRSSARRRFPDGVPFVRVGDINNGKVELANMKRISATIAAQYPRTKLHGGELAITLVGAIGRTAIIPESLEGGNTARAVGIIPLTKQVNAHWVEIWFRNPAKNAEMDSKSHEVARKTLNLEDVRIASVALPPLAEQTRIVAEVERRLSVADKLEAALESTSQPTARLKQSILKRAFEPK